MRLTRKGFSSLIVSCSLSMMIVSLSQAQPSQQTEEANRRLQEILRQEQERTRQDLEDTREQDGKVQGIDTEQIKPTIATPQIGLTCRQIHEIRIQGAASLSSYERERIVRRFKLRCLTADRIQLLLSDLTNAYISAGMITTRAYLPPQDLSDGTLDILVLEGVVEKILFDDGDSNSMSVNNVLPFVEGKTLNLRDFEQGIEQINRLKSNNARMAIQPGSRPGTSHVVIKNDPKRAWFLEFASDNEGSESTGKVQSSVTGITENPLGFNERISLNHRRSTPGDPRSKNSQSTTLSLSIPVGYVTFSGGVNRSSYASTVEMPSGLKLIADGESSSDFVQLEQVIHRDATSKAIISGKLTQKTTRNYLDEQFLGVSSRNLTILDLDVSYKFNALGGSFSLDAGYARGMTFLAALKDPDNLPEFGPRAQFRKIKAGASYSTDFQLLGQNFGFASKLTAQKAETPLYGSEQLTIGGPYSVRGFSESSLSGDNGYHWRNDLSLYKPLKLGDENLKLRYYVAVDTGKVATDDPTIAAGRLTGGAIGVSANLRGASIEMYLIRSLDKEDYIKQEDSQAWIRFAYSY